MSAVKMKKSDKTASHKTDIQDLILNCLYNYPLEGKMSAKWTKFKEEMEDQTTTNGDQQ